MMKYPKHALGRIDLDAKRGFTPSPTDVAYVVEYANWAHRELQLNQQALDTRSNEQ